MLVKMRRDSKHYLMILPFFLFFSIFFLYPIMKGFYTSFFNWDAIPTHTPEFIGLKNYANVLKSPYFIKSVTNLAKYVLLTVPIGITVAFLLALFVNSLKRPLSSFFRSAYFLPVTIPIFLAGSIFRWMYQPEVGLINVGLSFLGIGSINWLNDTRYMIPAVVMLDVWRAAGFNMVIILAGMQNIPQELYEAAKVDGANAFQEVIHITIPQLQPVLFFVISFGFISALQIFDAPWLLSASSTLSYGGPSGGMLFPMVDLMGRAFGDLKFGLSSAYGFIMTTVILLVTAIMFALQRRNNR